MNILKKLVVKNLVLNKKRTIVSIIGIMLAVALLTALFTITASFRSSIIRREIKMDGDYHVIFYDVPSGDVDKLRQNRKVENIRCQTELGYAYLEGCVNEYKPYANICAMDKDALEDSAYSLDAGRYPTNSNEIVIGHHVITNGRVDLKIGDTITLNIGNRIGVRALGDEMPIGQSCSYGTYEEEYIADAEERTFTIVGIIKRPSYEIEPYSAPGYTFVTVFDNDVMVDRYDKVYIRYTQDSLLDCVGVTATLLGIEEKEYFEKFNDIDSGARIHATEEEWTYYCDNILPLARYNWNFHEWLIRYERLWPIDSMFITIFIIAGFVGLVIIGTSIYCIKNSFEISVAEKIRLYGMLAGVGATKKQIRKSVLFEAAVEGVIGLPLGVGLGLLASFILSRITNMLLSDSFIEDAIMQLNISWIAILVSVVLGIVTIYFSSISATIMAGKVAPIEAIRNTNEIKIDSQKIKVPGYISKICGVGGVIAYKNIKRNKKKYKTTVVSISICTVTFIVVSYFMSLLFGVANNVYAEDDCNIIMYIDQNEKDRYEELELLLADVQDIKQLSYISRNYCFIDSEGVRYTDSFQKVNQLSDEEMEAIADTQLFTGLFVLDDASFIQYEKDCGKKVKAGEVIFVNYSSYAGLGVARMFEYSGDSLLLYENDYENAIFDENGEALEGTVTSKKIEVAIGAETDVRPFGLTGSTSDAMIVMSASTFDDINMEELLGRGRYVTEVFFDATDADKCQDELEKITENNYNGNYSIFNRNQSARSEKQIYMLLAVFAYGLIIVIALIGITNIINTLGTGMELRARDFATLRSIGMTKGQFDRMVLLESIFTSVKSLFWGVVIGVGLTIVFWVFECRMDIVIRYNPPIKAILINIAVVMLLVYGIISTSLNKVNKRNIVETIKNENL